MDSLGKLIPLRPLRVLLSLLAQEGWLMDRGFSGWTEQGTSAYLQRKLDLHRGRIPDEKQEDKRRRR